MPKRRTPRRYLGPISRRTSSRVKATRCGACGQSLPSDRREVGNWWCWSCKDPDGVTLRLQQAQHEAAQRCAERYPCQKATQGELFA